MKKITSLLFAIGLAATALTSCNKGGGSHKPQPTPIDLVNVSVGEPTLGQTPLEVRSSFVVYSYVCDVTTIEWTYKNNSGQWAVLDNDVVFTYDTEYRFEMTITANDKFAFNDNTEFKVDGIPVTEGVAVQSTTLTYTKQFAAVSATISSVAITGVTAPVAGAYRTTQGITANDARVVVDFSNTKWYRHFPGETPDYEWQAVAETTPFASGAVYKIRVCLMPASENFSFATNASATINGDSVTEASVDYRGDFVVFLVYPALL